MQLSIVTSIQMQCSGHSHLRPTASHAPVCDGASSAPPWHRRNDARRSQEHTPGIVTGVLAVTKISVGVGPFASSAAPSPPSITMADAVAAFPTAADAGKHTASPDGAVPEAPVAAAVATAPPLPVAAGVTAAAATTARPGGYAAAAAAAAFSSFSPRFQALDSCDKHAVAVAIQRYFRQSVSQFRASLPSSTRRRSFFANRWRFYGRELAHLHSHTTTCDHSHHHQQQQHGYVHHHHSHGGEAEGDDDNSEAVGEEAANGILSLATKQWLECVDVHHRYGHNLRIYFALFMADKTTQDRNFFFWLDFGDGRTATTPECPRDQLEAGRVKYCTALERQHYEVAIRDGVLTWRNRGDGTERLECPKAARVPKADRYIGMKDKWIFVADIANTLYVGQKTLCNFHHSSFFAGAPVRLAGGVVVKDGRLTEMSPHSGHYRPSKEVFDAFLSSLAASGVDMDTVAIASFDK